MREAGAEPVGLLELAGRADFVSVHVPLVEATRGLIGREFLSCDEAERAISSTRRAAPSSTTTRWLGR